MVPCDDVKLIRGCLEGRKDSWDLFVERYSRLVWWSIWKTLENRRAASKDDLCREVYQDFFEKALDPACLKRFLDAKNLRNYIQSIVCHLVFDRLRRASRQERSELSMDALDQEAATLDAPDAAGILASLETNGIVRAVVEGLTVREKNCIQLCYAEGRTHREIGLLLGIPQDTVSTVIRRTKERLKEALLEKGISGLD